MTAFQFGLMCFVVPAMLAGQAFCLMCLYVIWKWPQISREIEDELRKAQKDQGASEGVSGGPPEANRGSASSYHSGR